jgi:peptidylprolyl isomerase
VRPQESWLPAVIADSACMVSRSILLSLLLLLLPACERDPITIKPSKVQMSEERTGEGPMAKAGDVVVIDYTVRLPDGSLVLEEQGFDFRLGTGVVIEGIDDSVVGMQRGGWRRINCPPNKHWGARGYADRIPPRSMLDIELTLVRIR